ncbi:hypothetical protein B0H19DRAFT_661849 [Mycena capillaripes]|nr:hypothetical protein B0H19DRAFT_661849 [Mycena capillaripes]
MPPPSRPQSIHSWWSDSNKPGATISIHPLASRLSKLLYHRQVIGVIKQSSPPPLSESELDAFVPYLPCVYHLVPCSGRAMTASTRSNLLWNSTKILILKEILVTSKFDLGAKAVLETQLPHVLVELLQTQNDTILELTCSILESIFSGSRKISGAYELSPTSIYSDLGGSLLLLLRKFDFRQYAH